MKTWNLVYSNHSDTFYLDLHYYSFLNRLKLGVYDLSTFFIHKICPFIPLPPIPVFHKNSTDDNYCGKGWHFHNPYKWWGHTITNIGCSYLCSRSCNLIPSMLINIPITNEDLERLKKDKQIEKLINRIRSDYEA